MRKLKKKVCAHHNFWTHDEELRETLYAYFSQFGTIMDVVAMKTPKNKGQAFVVFKDIVTASNAMRESQDFVFFGKKMVRADYLLD